jgi:ATP phosphoribosyltransferase regulatory subunit
MSCHGDISCLEQITKISNTAKKNVEELKELAANYSDVDFHFDMTDFPGFDYHKGLVFSVHSSKYGFAIANGGQYQSKSSDNNMRNAIGFDIDLISLIKIKMED